MEIGMTHLSSKGQIVIPRNIRERMGFVDGEFLTVLQKENLIVLKKIENPMEQDDLETFFEIKKSWEEIEKGRFKKTSSQDFLEEVKKW